MFQSDHEFEFPLDKSSVEETKLAFVAGRTTAVRGFSHRRRDYSRYLLEVVRRVLVRVLAWVNVQAVIRPEVLEVVVVGQF